jgi:hypothetical protein
MDPLLQTLSTRDQSRQLGMPYLQTCPHGAKLFKAPGALKRRPGKIRTERNTDCRHNHRRDQA